MRRTNTDFLNALAYTAAPVYVRFETSSILGTLIVRDQSGSEFHVEVPGSIDLADLYKPSPTTELLDRLTELKKRYATAWLPHSCLPSEDAFQNAREFVSTLPLNRIVKPEIHVATDGEVNFQWSGPDFHIDLGFYGDGRFSFYGEKKGHAPLVGDEVPVKDGIPKHLEDFASGG